MNSKAKSDASNLKTDWEWDEWQNSRAARRTAAMRIGPPLSRRKKSSSDQRLQKAFEGERGPPFKQPGETS